jgi:adenine-specific DNA methylase
VEGQRLLAQAPGYPAATILEAGSLPVRELAGLAVREGRRPKPVYGTHKWFARRLGTAFRGLLIGASLPDGANFWDAFENGVNLAGLTMLDPFVGGGTSVIEAQRLGMTCIGVDVDAVAVSITSFQSRLAELPDLGAALAELRQEIGAVVAPYHRRPDGREVLHHFWVQVVPCAACGRDFDAHPNFVLADEVDATHKHVFCGSCGDVHTVPKAWKSFTCKGCGDQTSLPGGRVDYGKASCPHCGREERLIEVGSRTGLPPRFRMFAVETIPAERSSRPVPMRERTFAKADAADLAAYAESEARLAKLLNDGGPGLPDRLIPAEGRSDDRPLRYGYRRYTDFFNARQQLHLLLLSRAILRLDGPVREALSIAFSDHLKTNCMLASYALGYRRLSPLFALRAFRHVPRPVEANPWVEGTGRGSFPNAVRQVSRAAAWVREEREYARSGGFVPSKGGSRGRVDVRVCSAASLAHVPDGTVDLVMTDPPYFDNIAYSELADFFLPWQQHLGLITGKVQVGFPAEQLAAPSRDQESAAWFAERLSACFQKVAAKMKPGALAAFTYQHSTAAGWLTLAEALADVPIEVVRVFPLAGDTGANLHREQASICWDAVLVARRVEAVGPRDLQTSAAALEAADSEVARWTTELKGVDGLPFRDGDALNLRRALLVAESLKPQPEPPERRAPLVELLHAAALAEGQPRRDAAQGPALESHLA